VKSLTDFWRVTAVLLAAVVAGPVSAATFNVSKTADTADGVCNADCSLREAVIAANATVALDTINIPAGTYTITIFGRNEDAAATGDFDILEDLNIVGAGQDQTIIDGAQIDRVFHTLLEATVSISDMTITGGDAPGSLGGGICAEFDINLTNVSLIDNLAAVGGGLTNFTVANISNVIFENNTASEQSGGAIDNAIAVAHITDSTFINNVANAWGGAIDNAIGEAYIERSTFHNNRATQFSGGIDNDSGILRITNSTFTDNQSNLGGAVWTSGDTSFLNTTIVGNADTAGQWGVVNDAGTVSFENTILSNAPGFDCNTTSGVTSVGRNIESSTSCGFVATGDMQNTDPLVGPLQDNGGPTLTVALLQGSPAIDAGANARCPDTDQRGEVRPIDGNGDGSTVCDIGAYEFSVLVPDDKLIDLVSFDDINTSGSADLAVLEAALQPAEAALALDGTQANHLDTIDVVHVRDGGTGQEIVRFEITDEWDSVAMDTITVGGVVRLLVMQTKAVGATRVLQFDARDGTQLSTIPFFDNTWTAVDLIAVRDALGPGQEGVGVLATNQAGQHAIEVRKPGNGGVIKRANYFNNVWGAFGATDLGDFNGNGRSELAVLARNGAGKNAVEVRDALSGVRLSRVFYLSPNFSLVDLASTEDVNNNGRPEIVILGDKDGSSNTAQAKDAKTGELIAKPVMLGPKWATFALRSMDDVDGNGGPEIVAAAVDAGNVTNVLIRDLVAETVTSRFGFLGPAYDSRDMEVLEDVTGNSIQELVMVGRRDDTGQIRVQIRDGKTTQKWKNIDLPIQ
jgi:CSLREA domain-containing protein